MSKNSINDEKAGTFEIDACTSHAPKVISYAKFWALSCNTFYYKHLHSVISSIDLYSLVSTVDIFSMQYVSFCFFIRTHWSDFSFNSS